MDVEFIEPASIELDDAIEYYNQQSNALGDSFFDEVLETINLTYRFFQKFGRKLQSIREKPCCESFPII